MIVRSATEKFCYFHSACRIPVVNGLGCHLRRNRKTNAFRPEISAKYLKIAREIKIQRLKIEGFVVYQSVANSIRISWNISFISDRRGNGIL
ncbi:hypothetical protein TNIN_241621 [Trichonephila inaurata madagascariensis]|uniref:Uncharacterized protein n=1 Tax=Trichonephila inaurata madagascariensis TaxID=2747483 RepID=A0A8X6YB12_9ARAC|nr:hypothetical protein TNIN_241621 [Trichonephila inaurata madagascariensis]